MESILETKASTILEFLSGLRGSLSVTFEEPTTNVDLYYSDEVKRKYASTDAPGLVAC